VASPGFGVRGYDDRGAESSSIDAPKAPSGVGYGEGSPLPSRLGVCGSVVSSPSGVRGRAPAAIAFSACFKPQNASGSEKIRCFAQTPKYKEKLVFLIYENVQIPHKQNDSHVFIQRINVFIYLQKRVLTLLKKFP